MEVARAFIYDVLPTHTIGPVKGDGFCMLHTFQKSLAAKVGRKETLDSLVFALRNELKDSYQKSSEDTVNIKEEFEQYLLNPLSKYNTITGDLSLDALGMAFQVNVLIFKSNCYECVIYDLANPDNGFEHTLHFVRTLSVHLDPVVPLPRTASPLESNTSILISDDEDHSEGHDLMILTMMCILSSLKVYKMLSLR